MSVVTRKIVCKSDHVGFFGVTPNPSFSLSQSALTFGLTMLSEVSASQAITVSGTQLSSPIVVTAPAGFIINTNNSNSNQSPITLNPSTGTVNATVYVKFAPTLYQPYGPVNITASCTGLATQNVALDGTVDLQSDLLVFYNALGGAKPAAANLLALQKLMLALENVGFLATVDLFHVFTGMQTDEQRSTLLKTNGGNAAFSGSVSNDVLGIQGDGSSGYLALGWTADSDGVLFLQNDSSYLFYSVSSIGSGASGTSVSGKSNSYIYPRKIDGNSYFGLNTDESIGDDRIAVTNAKGLYCVKRKAANSINLKKDGTLLSTATTASDVLNDVEEVLGAINTGAAKTAYSNHKYGLVAYGSSQVDDNTLLYYFLKYAADLGLSV